MIFCPEKVATPAIRVKKIPAVSIAILALMTKAWWMILIPGASLVTLFICLTNVGNWLRKSANRKESSL